MIFKVPSKPSAHFLIILIKSSGPGLNCKINLIHFAHAVLKVEKSGYCVGSHGEFLDSLFTLLLINMCFGAVTSQGNGVCFGNTAWR